MPIPQKIAAVLDITQTTHPSWFTRVGTTVVFP